MPDPPDADPEGVSLVLEQGGRLDAVLSDALPDLSRSRLSRLIKGGRVAVDDAVATRPSTGVTPGQRVTVDVPPPAPAEAVPQDLPLSIVHQDADVVVIDKVAGMVVHPGAGHPDGTLVNALLHHVGDLSGIGGVLRPGIVHRLDRGTSGLLVVAKHDRAHQALAAQFADHSARRSYQALTLAAPGAARGTIRSTLARHPRDRVRWASTTDGSGKHAVTHWTRLGVGRAGLGWIGCELETGRTHQIRVHLTEQGWPLIGDPTYRLKRLTTPSWLRDLVDEDRPLLHAWRLRFSHPGTGEAVAFEAPPPADFRAVLARAELADGEP